MTYWGNSRSQRRGAHSASRRGSGVRRQTARTAAWLCPVTLPGEAEPHSFHVEHPWSLNASGFGDADAIHSRRPQDDRVPTRLAARSPNRSRIAITDSKLGNEQPPCSFVVMTLGV